MKINKIAIAIAALILGILILIGGIRITKANVLSQTLQAQDAAVLLARDVRNPGVVLDKNLLRSCLSNRNLDHHKMLVTLNSHLLNGVGLDRLDNLELHELSVLDRV